MSDWPLLSLVTFLPLVGVAFILLSRGSEEIVARNARSIALWTSLITFLVSILLWTGFDNDSADFQFVETVPWIPAYGITYHMGVDGISMFFVLLSTFLTPICVLASWQAIQTRVKEYMVAFLVLETLMVGMFAALDFVLFYLFFEGVLIPMFLIIGVWGGARRVYAAFKFFLYTLLGSVLMLLAILAIYFEAGSTDIPTLIEFSFPVSMQTWLWLAFFASFSVKVPMWPVHTWLPDAQEDMKKLIAYSSVAHMGIVTIGIFTLNLQALQGALIQMLSHGVVSAALFLVVGVVYDRIHSREISRYGGLVHRMPRYALVFMIFILASVGLPGTSGFVGEFLVLVGAFQVNTWVAFLGTTGIILGAAYALWLYRRVVFGKLEKADLRSILDLSPREIAVFAPLIVVTFWMGIYPASFLKPMNASVLNLVARYELSQAPAGSTRSVAAAEASPARTSGGALPASRTGS